MSTHWVIVKDEQTGTPYISQYKNTHKYRCGSIYKGKVYLGELGVTVFETEAQAVAEWTKLMEKAITQCNQVLTRLLKLEEDGPWIEEEDEEEEEP